MSTTTHIVCPGCQKRYAWNPALAGKKVRCACGQVIEIAQQAADDLLDLAPEPAPAPAKPKVERASLEAAIRTRMGVIPGKTSETKERERLEAHRAAEAAVHKPSAARDTAIPIVLIAAGLVLLFVEQMNYAKNPSSSAAAAFPMVLGRAIFATALLAGGMFLARALLDVTFVHNLKDSALRMIAIAVFPCAIYGICSASMGDLAGPCMGVLFSITIYAVLFWYLLQLDVRDVSICVMMTWILVAMSNYAAFRAEAYYDSTPFGL